MKNSLKKRGQKFIKHFSRFSQRASEEGKQHLKENFFYRFSHIRNIRLLILEWILLIITLIMFATTQAFWFTNSYSENAFVEGGIYTEATLGKITSMNPLFAITSSEKVLSKILFATLTTIDYSGHPGLGLAQSIIPSENGKVWTVKLRDHLKWSDGEPLTNADVLFTINLIKNPNVNSIYKSNFSNIEITESPEGKIIFQLPTPYNNFMSVLDFPIIPKHILGQINPEVLIEHEFSTQPIGSGAFCFNASQTITPDGEKIIYLSANPFYYKGKPLIASFAIHNYLKKSQIITALNTGTITATAELSPKDAPNLPHKQIYEKSSNLNYGVFAFFNTTKTPLNHIALRSAIRQGIDVSYIRSLIPNTNPIDYPLLPSQATLSTYPPLPTHDVNASVQTITNQFGTPTLSVVTANTGYLPTVAQAFVESLRQLNINAELNTYEEDQDFINNVINKRNYDILIYEIELGANYDLFPYYHSSQITAPGLNLSNYTNVLVDDLLLGARQTLNPTLRTKKYESFLKYWVADIPAIGLYQSNLTYFYNKNIRTFSDNIHLSTPLDRFSDLTSWGVTKKTKNRTP